MTTPYLMQPDTNSVCCDCSQRTSPCDDCACTATISSQQSYGSLGKCGEFNDDYNSQNWITIRKYWLEKTDHYSGDNTYDGIHSTVDWTATSQYANCVESVSYEGGSQTVENGKVTCSLTGAQGYQCRVPDHYGTPTTTETTSTLQTYSYDDALFYTRTQTFSSEYTTYQLIQNALAAMPAYTNNTQQNITAFMAVDSPESNVYITKLKYTITPPPGRTASWNVVFTPPGGSPAPTAMSCTSAQTYEIIPAQSGSWIVQDIACS